MNKGFTTEEFINKARKIHGYMYDYSMAVYQGYRKRTAIVCKIHGIYWQTPRNHIKGNGCPCCGGTKKLTREEFIFRAIKVHGNKYSYEKVIYKSLRERVSIICFIHGIFFQKAGSHLDGEGCPMCYAEKQSLSKRLTTEQFITNVKKVHGDRYDYSRVNYVNCYAKVEIICRIHGIFLQTPSNHLAGSGCQKCAKVKKPTTKEFIEMAKKVHNNIYNYAKTNYINCQTEVTIICKDHGEFKQVPYSHLKGCGCPYCNTSNGELLVARILDENKIKYEKQKTFDSCRNPKTKRLLLYDFYLSQQNILIEYNGSQHYINTYYYNKGGEKTFQQQQYRDSIKKDYALSNGYKFLVIKYNDKNIEEIIKKAINR